MTIRQATRQQTIRSQRKTQKLLRNATKAHDDDDDDEENDDAKGVYEIPGPMNGSCVFLLDNGICSN